MPVEAPVELSNEILALTPHMQESDLLNIIYARIVKGEKFAFDDFHNPGHIAHDLAHDFARNYNGTFGFMVDMKQNARYGRLRLTMTPGIVNCWYNEVRGIQIRSGEDRGPERIRARVVNDDAPIGLAPTEITPAKTVEVAIEDGYYTLSFTDGSHLTLRIRTKQDDPNVQKVAVLTGPDNTTDYKNFGFLKGSRYVPFSAFRTGYDRWHWAVGALLGLDNEQRLAAGIAYAQKSVRCYKCGMELTDPESIRLGIGPTCRNKE